MPQSPSSPAPNGEHSLVVEIVEALEEEGLDGETYQLHQYVDPDALTQLVASLNGEFTVSFTVDTIHVDVTQNGVTATPVDQVRRDTTSGE